MNLYVVLGLQPGASTAEIKRAYRRLARQYHPGINPGDRAAEVMYQRIAEAYGTLSDPVQRRVYDSAAGDERVDSRGSFTFAEFDFSARAHGAQASTFTELFAEVLHPMPGRSPRSEAGADLHASLTLPFADAARGVERQIVVTRHVVCGACRGAGETPAAETACTVCDGAGRTRWARGHMVFAKPCDACRGSGRSTRQRCVVCAGQGRGVRSDALTVAVPAGMTDGARLRLPGEGHCGRNDGSAGDLYVTVRVQPHPVFSREADDLVCVLPVAIHEAVLGARIDVPSLDGGLKLRVPPNTAAGQRLRIEGRGIPLQAGRRGDLVFEVRIVVPPVHDERSRELVREFARLNDHDVRKQMLHG